MPGIPYAKPYAEGIPFAKSARDAERDAFYNSSRWKATRKAFIARDVMNNTCARCRAVGRTEPTRIIHHIKERITHPELAFKLDNLEPLCQGCHNKIHKTKRR